MDQNVEGHYVKENWSMVPSQREPSFNDGELVLFEMALYDPMRWTWADDPPDPMHWPAGKRATLDNLDSRQWTMIEPLESSSAGAW